MKVPTTPLTARITKKRLNSSTQHPKPYYRGLNDSPRAGPAPRPGKKEGTGGEWEMEGGNDSFFLLPRRYVLLS